MDANLHKELVSSLLPEHDDLNENYDSKVAQQSEVESQLKAKELRQNAAAIALMKYKEKRELQKLEARKSNPTFGMTKKELDEYEKQKARTEENIAELEIIEQSPEAQSFLAGNSDISPYAGTTRRDVAKLLSSLNINLSMHLTKSDTYNLLSCLLTCNEAQLAALYNNKKVPLAIKTVIKRLQEDCKLGNIETIEKLWDRIFGKADKAVFEMPTVQTQQMQGIIPNTVVSREAYMIIRDTIIGK